VSRTAEAAPTLAGTRVLVVEDQVVVALDLAQTLRGLGCVVLGPASEPAQVLALLRRERPDAVLLDLGLRGGFDAPLAAAMAAAMAAAGVPLVLLGCPREGSGLPVAPSVAYLDKPLGTAPLRRVLARLVGRRGGADRAQDG
jgi:CheY-like chemotaxis protein